MRKITLLVGIILLSAGAFYACRQRRHAEPEKLFLEKLHAIETAVPPVWPGFSSAKAPMIVRFGEEGALLVGVSPNAECGFRPVKDFFSSISKAPENSFFKPGYFEPWLQIFNLESFRSCAGEVHFSNYNLMRGILSRDVLFHEYFHSYQKRNFKWPYGRQLFSFGLSPEQTALAYIEQLLIAKALRSSGPVWKDYARAYTALRLHRRQLPDPHALNPREDALEAIEGTALYFESRTRDFDVETPNAMRAKAQRGAFPTQTDLHIAGELLATEFTPDMMLYWRQYNTGAAMGLLLDRAGADWKTGVQDGGSLFSFFSAVFAVMDGDRSKIVETAKSEYDYAGLLSVAKRTMFPREIPFTGNDYSSRIIIRTRGNPSFEAKHQPGVPEMYHFKDGSSARPFMSLKIKQEGAFNLDANSFGALLVSRELHSGKEHLRLEISLLFSLSRLSIDKTGCTATPQGLICKHLAFYGPTSEAHFEVPVKLTEQGKILTLEVQP